MLRCCLNPITPTYLCNTAAAMNLALFEGLTRHPVTKATASPHQYFVVAAPLPASLSLLSIPYPCYRSPIPAWEGEFPARCRSAWYLHCSAHSGWCWGLEKLVACLACEPFATHSPFQMWIISQLWWGKFVFHHTPECNGPLAASLE